MSMPSVVVTVIFEKPRSENIPAPSRVVADGSTPFASSASMTARAKLRLSSPPLAMAKPLTLACIQSDDDCAAVPLAIDSLPPLPPVTRLLLAIDAPPPTSSVAPRSRRVWNSGSEIWIAMLPPSSAEAVAAPSALRRPVGSAVPITAPSTPALLSQTPAVDRSAVPRTVTRSDSVTSSGETGSVSGSVGRIVRLPAGRLMSPAMSICGERRVSSAPTPEAMLTPSGMTMRPLAFSSTEPKPFSTRPSAVCVAAPNNCDAPSLTASTCRSVSAVVDVKKLPSVLTDC